MYAESPRFNVRILTEWNLVSGSSLASTTVVLPSILASIKAYWPAVRISLRGVLGSALLLSAKERHRNLEHFPEQTSLLA